MFNKFVLTMVLLLVATSGWATGPQDVSAGTHNLGSTTHSLYGYEVPATNEDEVCIFCHTPHGGTLNGPLWNHALPDAADPFTHYTSTTLSGHFDTLGANQGKNRAVNSESLLCLGCHDGVVAMNSIVNISNRTDVLPNLSSGQPMPPGFFGNNPVIGDPQVAPPYGKNLSDDHPISFSYYDDTIFGTNSQKLHTVTDAKNKGIRFFGPAGAGGDRMECSTCHDPHVNYTPTGNPAYAPFLVMSNNASALCLACHKK